MLNPPPLPENRAVYEVMCKMLYSRPGQENIIWCIRFACCIPRLHTHTHNMQRSLLFHSNNGYTDVPQYYIISTLPLLLIYISYSFLNCAYLKKTVRKNTTRNCTGYMNYSNAYFTTRFPSSGIRHHVDR